MLILDLWGISFHAVVVFGLGKNLLFKSILGRCVVLGSTHAEKINKKNEMSFNLRDQFDVNRTN